MISLEDIKKAQKNISNYIFKTPQVYSAALSKIDQRVSLKLESMQITGSFKLRGATNKLLSLDNCLIMPHVASATHDTRMKMALMCVENIISGLRGDFPPYCVNTDSIINNSRLKN